MTHDEDRGADPWETSFEGKKVVIGLGNPYMRDDGVGLVVADDLRKRRLQNVAVYKYAALDLALIWDFKKASKIVIVDAMRSGLHPGTIQTYAITGSKDQLTELPSLHSLQLHDLFDLANDPGQNLCPVVLVGIEPKSTNPGEGLTSEIVAKVPELVETVTKELDLS